MKEHTLKEILSKPVIDASMDEKITETLLSYDDYGHQCDKEKFVDKRYQFVQKVFTYGIAKIAVVVLVLSVVGVGTVWAAGLFKVKSKSYEIELLTQEEYEEAGYEPFDFEQEVIRKEFGKDLNKLITPHYDSNGNILEVDEEGYITLEDGSKYQPVVTYTPDPERFEKARVSGGEAFAEIGFPNLVPTYIYDNYILSPDGFGYRDYLNIPFRKVAVQFLKDAYKGGGNFHDEIIWMEFIPREKDIVVSGGIRVVEDKDNFIFSKHTTKGGILCTITQYKDSDHIIVEIEFESDTIGNGSMMIEFQGVEWDKVTEILDTLPLTEDHVDSHINE